MSPFKNYYAQAIETCLITHPGRVIIYYQISELVGKVVLWKLLSMVFEKQANFDRNVFKEHEFVQFENEETEEHDDLPVEIREDLSTNASEILDPSTRHEEPAIAETVTTVGNESIQVDISKDIALFTRHEVTTANSSPFILESSTSSFGIVPADISPIPQFKKSVQTARTG